MSSEELFTARGRLLIEVMDKPGIIINALASNLYLTKRTVWGIVGELRSMGYLGVKTAKGDRRTHHYYVSSLGLAELRKLTEQADKGTGW